MKYENGFNMRTPDSIIERIGKYTAFEFVDLVECTARYKAKGYWLTLQADEVFNKLSHIMAFVEFIGEEYVLTDEEQDD